MSASPLSLYGINSPSPSPKYPLTAYNSQVLLPIPETSALDIQKDTNSTVALEKLTLNKLVQQDSFTLPEPQNQVVDTKKLKFTISVVPVRYEDKVTNDSPTQQLQSPPLIKQQEVVSLQSVEDVHIFLLTKIYFLLDLE